MLTIRFDGSSVTASLDRSIEGSSRAIVRALNRAIGASRTVMVKAIAGDVGLKSGDVRDALTMRTATFGSPYARLSAGLKRIPLMAFGARQTRVGVSYKLQGGRDTIPSAFIATMRTGHQGVFVRSGKARLPIRELFGPSLGHVFIKYQPDAIARAEEVFAERFEHEMSGAWSGTPVPAGDDAGAE